MIETKACNKCRVDKPKSEYYPRPARPCGVVSRCKDCLRARDRVRIASPEFKSKKRIADAMPKNKERRRAYMSTDKFRIAWDRYKQSPLGRSTTFANRLKKYGLTIEDYNCKLARQGHVCAICKQINDNGKILCVDHCHATGKIRGLLCYRCNLLIGHARERIETLNLAVDYLESWSRIPVSFGAIVIGSGNSPVSPTLC